MKNIVSADFMDEFQKLDLALGSCSTKTKFYESVKYFTIQVQIVV